MEIPVYLFTGFLEAGKTQFIQETLEDENFNAGENTLLLVCEEGVEEYGTSRFADAEHIHIEYVEGIENLDAHKLSLLEHNLQLDRVMIEQNGMTTAKDLLERLPENWAIYQEVMFADAQTFQNYNTNMRSLVVDKLQGCELIVFNRCDEAYAGDIAKLKMEFPDAIFISANTSGSISLLRARLSQMVRTSEDIEGSLVPDNLVCEGDYVLLLVPESVLIHEYLIMMDLINRGARCVIIHEDDLENALKEIPRVDLVIAYARSFGKVRDIVPENVPLTSYSLLYAKQRGVLEDFIAGARKLGDLKENSRILVAVGSRASEVYKEIGRIKIPRSLRRVVGEELQIDYNFGLDLPEDLSSYDLVIHDTGATMSTRSVQARVAICREAGVPSANYGTVLAALAGVLDRCEAVLLPKE